MQSIFVVGNPPEDGILMICTASDVFCSTSLTTKEGDDKMTMGFVNTSSIALLTDLLTDKGVMMDELMTVSQAERVMVVKEGGTCFISTTSSTFSNDEGSVARGGEDKDIQSLISRATDSTFGIGKGSDNNNNNSMTSDRTHL